ncbi:MAG: signal peptidase I [Marinilabiliaceae bacterium]|nr:signal peptidase I [Marinilabiliaceae bacterium]
MDNKQKIQQLIKNFIDDGKIIDIPVFGLSMFPFFLPGTIVRIGATPFDQLKMGDVVLFKSDSKYVMHRLVKCNDNGLLTKGDSLPYYDSNITRDRYIGKVIAYYSGNKLKETTSVIFRIWALLMIGGQRYLGSILHFFSFIWYKYVGSKKVM